MEGATFSLFNIGADGNVKKDAILVGSFAGDSHRWDPDKGLCQARGVVGPGVVLLAQAHKGSTDEINDGMFRSEVMNRCVIDLVTYATGIADGR